MLHLKEYLPQPEGGQGPGRGHTVRRVRLGLRVEAMPEGSEVIGLECDPKTVEEAREKNGSKGITFVQGEGAHMDFPDGTFELVAISNSLHHIEDYDAVLKEMLRVLKPDGWFLVNEMYSDNQNEAQQTHFLQHTLEAKLDMLSGGFQRPTWNRQEIVDILSSLPLTDVKMVDMLGGA